VAVAFAVAVFTIRTKLLPIVEIPVDVASVRG
jgi:hypothetical protein